MTSRPTLSSRVILSTLALCCPTPDVRAQFVGTHLFLETKSRPDLFFHHPEGYESASYRGRRNAEVSRSRAASEAPGMFTRRYCREENQVDFKDLEEAVHHMTKDHLICDMAAVVGGELGCYGHAETENV